MIEPNCKSREGFEHWDKFCALPRYSFWRGDEDEKGAVIRVDDHNGHWLNCNDVSKIVDDMQNIINELTNELNLNGDKMRDIFDYDSICGAVNKITIDEGVNFALDYKYLSSKFCKELVYALSADVALIFGCTALTKICVAKSERLTMEGIPDEYYITLTYCNINKGIKKQLHVGVKSSDCIS